MPDTDQHGGWTGVLNQIHDVDERFFNGFQLPFSEQHSVGKERTTGAWTGVNTNDEAVRRFGKLSRKKPRRDRLRHLFWVNGNSPSPVLSNFIGRPKPVGFSLDGVLDGDLLCRQVALFEFTQQSMGQTKIVRPNVKWLHAGTYVQVLF